MDATAVRDRLERERADLAATVDRIKERLAVPQRDSGRQTMFEARLGLIDEALGRLERGEYGRCIVCGREIPEARLELVPETPYCVDDAEREQQSSLR
jgi:RNA polymerase-binding transcription factor DksA